ncbi:MAG: ABC transporter substrate-binding protein [Caulobacteraceae bacterium]|nr:ABC transporter substrate-binding protein [Caulobacteraceae bacterium]
MALALADSEALASPRVLSLDQCADQYVMALSPREAIVGVSARAGAPDSYLRGESADLPRRRATAEAVLAVRPNLVVRYWGGDSRLDRVLTRRQVRVVRIEEADRFDGVEANIRRVATAMGQGARGEALIGRLEAQLAASKGAFGGREALYLTPGGFTAGPGTLVDSILTAAGLRNAAPGPGYRPVSIESLVLKPPQQVVLGFFDGAGAASARWGLGRHGVARAVVDRRAIGSLPASVLGCPAWFAGDAVQALAEGARR